MSLELRLPGKGLTPPDIRGRQSHRPGRLRRFSRTDLLRRPDRSLIPGTVPRTWLFLHAARASQAATDIQDGHARCGRPARSAIRFSDGPTGPASPARQATPPLISLESAGDRSVLPLVMRFSAS